jgi:type I restriction enzyme M protein
MATKPCCARSAISSSRREATNSADDVENAVYDLKGVNPHRKADVERRTPTELLCLVEAKGLEVAEALKVSRYRRGRIT